MRTATFLLTAVLLAVGAALPAHAEPFRAGQTLDQEQVAQVTATALAFMAPRILDPVPVAQLAMWGLRGLTTLDPRLSPTLVDGSLRLGIADSDGQHLLLARPAPAEQDAAGWGEAASEVIHAGWNASQSVRDARTEGVIHTFFDELFNHLDPYSRYVPPAEAAADQAERSGLAGTGIRVAERGDTFIVISVQPDSPAAEAELRAGERLLAVDGEDVTGSDPQTVAAMLAGPDGSTVTLALRDRRGRTRTRRLARAVLTPQTVSTRRDGPALVLRVAEFSSGTGRLLAQAITRGLAHAGRYRVRALVIDLRGNRGGLLSQAAAAASALLPTGVVATTEGRDPRAAHVFRADGEDVADGLPVIVLVDGRTASAAEILAAALADQGRAVVVGSATLGKGLVQTILPLPDGGALYVTWSRVLAPLGWPIQALGVLPQVCTSLGRDAALRQLAALALGDQPMARALARERGARAPLPAAEALEIRMACPAAVGRDLDLAAAGFLIAHPPAYDAALLRPTAAATP